MAPTTPFAESDYLVVKEVAPSRAGMLTRIYGVFSKSGGNVLAYISWYPSWRQYTLKTEPGTIWNPDCLDFLSNLIKKMMEERKTNGNS